jgi:polyferredoxin
MTKMQMPSWKHRRRLIYATYVLSVLMIVWAAINYAIDGEVARELIIGGVAMLSIILTAYTAFATLDDKWHFKDEDEEE